MDRPVKPLVLLGAAAAFLAACGGSQPPIGMPQAAANVAHIGRSASPFDPTPTKNAEGGYLYVSDYSGYEVLLFRYDPKTMTATAIGQRGVDSQPAGSCSDAKGNVYVVGSIDAESTGIITEFAFGTFRVLRTLVDSTGPPTGCSVDPTTGNLAVTNQNSNNSSRSTLAQVLIYSRISDAPKQISACYYNDTAGYDPSGNLWLECLNGYHKPASIEELPKGRSSFKPVTFDETFDYPGAIQWDGKYLDVSFANGDPYWAMGVYRTKISRSKLITVDTIAFDGEPSSGCSNGLTFDQWAMVSDKPDDLPSSEATQLLAGNDYCHTLPVWKYPAGGHPVRLLKIPTKYYDLLPNGETYVTRP